MNINNNLFEAITHNLNTVFDTVPTHPKTETREYGYYAMDCCISALMAYYQCPDQSKKNPKKLLSSVFDCGVMIRALCDSEKDFEKRNTLVYDFLESYDLWNDGWLDRLLSDEAVRTNIENSRELTIEETNYLSYNNYRVEISDNGGLQDMITVLVAIFMFASRIKTDFIKVQNWRRVWDFIICNFIKIEF